MSGSREKREKKVVIFFLRSAWGGGSSSGFARVQGKKEEEMGLGRRVAER